MSLRVGDVELDAVEAEKVYNITYVRRQLPKGETVWQFLKAPERIWRFRYILTKYETDRPKLAQIESYALSGKVVLVDYADRFGEMLIFARLRSVPTRYRSGEPGVRYLEFEAVEVPCWGRTAAIIPSTVQVDTFVKLTDKNLTGDTDEIIDPKWGYFNWSYNRATKTFTYDFIVWNQKTSNQFAKLEVQVPDFLYEGVNFKAYTFFGGAFNKFLEANTNPTGGRATVSFYNPDNYRALDGSALELAVGQKALVYAKAELGSTVYPHDSAFDSTPGPINYSRRMGTKFRIGMSTGLYANTGKPDIAGAFAKDKVMFRFEIIAISEYTTWIDI